VYSYTRCVYVCGHCFLVTLIKLCLVLIGLVWLLFGMGFAEPSSVFELAGAWIVEIMLVCVGVRDCLCAAFV